MKLRGGVDGKRSLMDELKCAACFSLARSFERNRLAPRVALSTSVSHLDSIEPQHCYEGLRGSSNLSILACTIQHSVLTLLISGRLIVKCLSPLSLAAKNKNRKSSSHNVPKSISGRTKNLIKYHNRLSTTLVNFSGYSFTSETPFNSNAISRKPDLLFENSYYTPYSIATPSFTPRYALVSPSPHSIATSNNKTQQPTRTEHLPERKTFPSDQLQPFAS